MSDKPTYKQTVINYFENNKIVAWGILLLLFIVFIGEVVSSLKTLGLNNDKGNKRCDQIDQNISDLNKDIKEAINSANNSINILKIKYCLSQHKSLLSEAEGNKCFTTKWKMQSLNSLKATLLSETHFFIKNNEDKFANQVIKDLPLLCKEILGHFNNYNENILSEKEKNALFQTTKINYYEN